MKYDDFPILNNFEYSLINNHYSSFLSFDRKDLLFNLCLELNSCLNYYNGIEKNFNKTTSDQIKQTVCVLEKLLDNISSQFNIKLTQKQIVAGFNLFSFMKQLNKILFLIFNWFENEQKEYYKTLAKKSFFELMDSKNNIFSALEKSKVDFFKHM